MAAHLAHKLPWAFLCGLLVQRRDANWRKGGTDAQRKRLSHAGRVIASTLREFQTTAKTTTEEMAVLDVRTWGIDETSRGAYTGYYDSLLWGYIELNMLLTDPERIEPLLRDYQGGCSFVIALLLGDHDGGHPEAIASKLVPAFDGARRLKPLTAEAMQTLRDHAALLFRCMYLLPGENKLLDDEFVVRRMYSYFACYDIAD